ncbi:MAG TPA: bifunctional 5,10-methylenetetrahydrofolate dehydrogenase/5,10-methenyltetrahydrofolate cyclohydrolase [Patescibacteria group bacterium]|nr:bifunctional 5,10-methylenetetrahydrofolate dehydrogenase/5,10-methenyltetrahydrofolate cyclohydrolase [Patescibacteria group bacterium]
MKTNPYIFDGRKFAQEKLVRLKPSVDEFKKSGIKLKLASLIVGDNPGSKLYLDLKKKRGEEVGIEVKVVSLSLRSSTYEIINLIKNLNTDKTVNGIMVQLPLPDSFLEEDKKKIIDSIDPKKDVDGLREDSLYIHPTVKAILEVFEFSLNIVRLTLKDNPCTVCVVGATGMVGKPLVRKLKTQKFNNLTIKLIELDINSKNISEFTQTADVIISCTGKPGLIKKEMIKKGVILLDVGSPDGDIEKNSYTKASFVSPVPGGIGPVTIACLMENVAESLGSR